MKLTVEYVKECKDKNIIFQQAIEDLLAKEELWNRESDNAGQQREIQEIRLQNLVKEYQEKHQMLEVEVKQEIQRRKEEGDKLLADCQKKKEALQQEREQILQKELQKSELLIQKRKMEIQSLKGRPIMFWDSQEKSRQRIRELEEENEEIKRKVVEISREYEQKAEILRQESNQLVQTYYVSDTEKNRLVKQAGEDLKNEYEERRKEILSATPKKKEKKINQELWKYINLPLLGSLRKDLERVHINSRFVLDKRANLDYIQIGRIWVKMPVIPKVKTPLMSVALEEEIKKYGSFEIDKRLWLGYPYTVSRYSQCKIPIIFYNTGCHFMNKEMVAKELKAWLTAYCITRHPGPVQIYCKRQWKKGELLPLEYENVNSKLIHRVSAKEMPQVLKAYYEECKRRQEKFAEEGFDFIDDYNQKNAVPLFHGILIWEDAILEEYEEIAYLLSKGSQYGMGILLFQDKKYKDIYKTKFMDYAGLFVLDGMDVLGSLDMDLGIDEVKEGVWDYRTAKNFVHLSQESIKWETSKPDEKVSDILDNAMKVKEPESYTITSKMIEDIIDSYIDEEVMGFLETEVPDIPEIDSKVKAEESIEEEALDEEKIVYVYGKNKYKLEMFLSEVLERCIQEKTREVFFFNFMENCSNYDFDAARTKGMQSSNELQYVSPDLLEKGLRILMEHITGGRKKVCLLISGIEYAGYYGGYSENEKVQIRELWEKLMASWRITDKIMLFAENPESCKESLGREISSMQEEEINVDTKMQTQFFG